MKSTALAILSVSVLVQCGPDAFRAPPLDAFRANVEMECLVHFNTIQNVNADGGRCDQLAKCVSREARDTVLARYDAWPAYQQLARDEAPPFVTVSKMRANAHSGGSDAYALLGVVLETRNMCLRQTGLRDELKDT